MEEKLRRLFLRMIAFDHDADLVQHFAKVRSFARLIAECEGVDPHTVRVLEAAALVHDIGIPLCDVKYGRHPGPLQEKEGPPLARAMLTELGFAAADTERVCALVGEHHTLSPVDGIDHQILLEADFIVNAYENGLSRESLEHALETLFATGTGKRVFSEMFGLEAPETA